MYLVNNTYCTYLYKKGRRMLKKYKCSYIITAISLVCICATAPTMVHAAIEAVGFAGSYWGADDPCNQIGLGKWAEAMEGFEDGMLDNGISSSYVKTWIEREVEAKDFTDPTMQTWGADDTVNTGTDWADIVWFRGHGGYTCSSTNGYYSTFAMDNDTNTCSISTKNHIRWHYGGEINVFVSYACHSGQLCVWSHDGYHLPNPNVNSYFAVWNAFHGVGTATTSDGTYYYDYIRSARAEGIGDDFLDMFTKIKSGSDNDICPVSIIFGIDQDKQEHIYTWGGFMDQDDPDSTANSAYFHLACDPAGGNALDENIPD